MDNWTIGQLRNYAIQLRHYQLRNYEMLHAYDPTTGLTSVPIFPIVHDEVSPAFM
jgi:hypothetical protein